MTKTKVLFTDGCYQAKTVKAINKVLNAGGTAVDTYLQVRDIVDTNEGGFDTAPREFVLSLIIDELCLVNWDGLAQVVGWRYYSEVRPTVWSGVDAQEHFDGECPVDWMTIEWIAELVDFDPCDIYAACMDQAVEANKKGDLKLCSWWACQGLAAMNYYDAQVTGA